MGSHYFKVQNINISLEDDILALVCPAKGYYDPEKPLEYKPDPNLPPTPEPGDGEIILICTTALDAAVNLKTTTSTGQTSYKIYGANDTLIYSQNVNSNIVFFYEFPSSGGIELTTGLEAFKIIITPVTGNITGFAVNVKANWAPLGWPILEAHIRCSEAITFNSAFLNQKYIQLIKFYGDHDSLGGLASFAEGTDNLKEATLPTSLESLSTLQSAFRSSGVEKVIIPATTMPALQSLYRTFYVSGIKENPFSNIDELPSLTTYEQSFSGTKNLKTDLILPEAPICANITYLSQGSAITKLIFRGKMNGTFTNLTVQGIIMDAHNCTEVVMPSEMLNLYDFTHMWRDAGSLRKVTLPKTVALSTTSQSGAWFVASSGSVMSNNVEEITKCDSWTVSENYFFTFGMPRKLKQFDQPTLRPGRLSMGGTSSNVKSLSYLNLDFSGLRATDTVNLRYNSFDATEINRIFGELPAIAGTIDIRNNPGYATCDKTIAQNKGWTVL